MDFDEDELSLRDIILEEGERVYNLFWDSDNPGAGADDESVYLWNGQYYPILSDDYDTQPYPTLQEVMVAYELDHFRETTVSIESTLLSAEQIAQLLHSACDGPHEFQINDETWYFDGETLKKLA